MTESTSPRTASDERSPRISFLLTNLNGGEELRRTLPRLVSVIGEERFRAECELVAVDAGSSDDSWAILSDFARSFPRTQVTQLPGSRGSGRARALVLARAALVAVLDSDTLLREVYREVLSAYLQGAGPAGRATLAYENMDGVRANLTCGFYPRKLLQSVGGWRDLYGAEDVDLWVRLIPTGQLELLPLAVADDAVWRATASGSESYRTERERRYAPGAAFYLRWIRQSYGRFVAYAYTLREKIREDWQNQPRRLNRLLDLVGSSIARLRFYLGHPPVLRLRADVTNGVALHEYLCIHLVRPSSLGLNDEIAELRVNRAIRRFVESGRAPLEFVAIYHELEQRGQLIFTDS